MNNIFKVKDGTIYNKDGIGFANLAVILDKNGGLLKYGDVSRGMKEVFEDIVNKYKKAGLEEMANDLFYIEFDRYEGVLTIEEICTFLNYMILVSANGENLMKMLSMNEKDLKKKLKELNELGF